MTEKIELLAAYYTLAVDVIPLTEDEVSAIPFERRVEAAAEAGYKGIGLLHVNMAATRDRLGFAEMRRILEANGMPHLELEMLGGWAGGGEEKMRSDRVRDDLLQAAQELGARNIKIGSEFGKTEIDIPGTRDAFTHLCRLADRHGTRVALEPMPFGNVSNLDVARQVIEDGSEFGGGLLIDIWHMSRGGIPFSEVARLPSNIIVSVELDDAAAAVEGTLLEDTIHSRRLCGEGALDIAGFLQAIRSTGFRDFYSVEVLSRDLRQLSVGDAAKRSFDTTIRQFQSHGGA